MASPSASTLLLISDSVDWDSATCYEIVVEGLPSLSYRIFRLGDGDLGLSYLFGLIGLEGFKARGQFLNDAIGVLELVA